MKQAKTETIVMRTVLCTVLIAVGLAGIAEWKQRQIAKRSVAKWEVSSGDKTFYSVALPIITDQGCVSIMNLDGKAQILCGNVQIGQR